MQKNQEHGKKAVKRGIKRLGIPYRLRFADELSDGRGGFRKNGRGVYAIEVDVGGEIQARHFLHSLFSSALSLVCLCVNPHNVFNLLL